MIIIGVGVNARRAFYFIKDYNLFNIVGFAVNSEYYSDSEFLDKPVYRLEHLHDQIETPFKVFVALLWNRLNHDRRKLYEYCEDKGYEFANLISPHSIMRSNSMIGKNCWINDYVLLQNDVKIGDNVVAMPYSTVETNSNVGSHTFIGSKALVGGGCKVGEQCFLGFNSVIFDSTRVGNKCIVGACTAVKRNLPDFSRIIVSENSMQTRIYSGNEIETKLEHTKNRR